MAAAALILVDLQTEFLSPKGNFPIAEQSRTSLQSRLEELVPKWRPRAPIIWVRSEYTPTEELRTSATTSEDEYLSGTHSGPVACCSAGSPGAQFPAEIEELVHPVDEVIVKHWYSAFKSTNLDYDLKQAGVSQIYIAGLLSHICVKATVRDALRRGYQVAVIKDCLGWRNEEVHAQAVARIAEMGAVLIESAGVMQDLTTVPPARVPSPDTVRHRKAAGKNLTYLGPGDTIGEGDSDLVLDLLPAAFADQAFRQLQEEVQWAVMHHRGSEVPRLVAVQGQVAFDGSFPIYRHPADESPPLLPFTPTVLLIKEHVERVLNHPVNHVLIQLYRGGTDYISPHADKTIDVVHGSKIVNVSLGAERLMILRTKKDAALEPATIEPTKMGSVRNAQRIPLPHNSMFVLGLETNAKWLHGIRQDKRLPTEKTPSEVAFDGARISLTFRRIGTFLTADQSLIYGQGATGKTLETARPVINGVEDETNRLIMGFGNENQRSDFDWEAEYGRGSDVLHFVNEAAPAS